MTYFHYPIIMQFIVCYPMITAWLFAYNHTICRSTSESILFSMYLFSFCTVSKSRLWLFVSIEEFVLSNYGIPTFPELIQGTRCERLSRHIKFIKYDLDEWRDDNAWIWYQLGFWLIFKWGAGLDYSWGGGKGALVSIASNSIASATVGTAPELIAPPPEGWFRLKARRDIDLK